MIDSFVNNEPFKNLATENDIGIFQRLEKTDIKEKKDIRDENVFERIDNELHDLNDKDAGALSEEQKQRLIEIGVSPSLLNKISFHDGLYEVKTRNSHLEGKRHPETGVAFERKTIDVNGEKLSGVFPEFESKFDAELPPDKLIAPDKVQFDECNRQLKEELKTNDELRNSFSARQLGQIENGDIPGGFVWNHNEETGKMQLVDAKIHQKTNHTGGKAIWSRGEEYR